MSEKIKEKTDMLVDRALSLDEKKFSTILFLTVIGFFYVIYIDYIGRDVNSLIADLVKTQIIGVLLYNTIDSAKEFFTKKNSFEQLGNKQGGGF